MGNSSGTRHLIWYGLEVGKDSGNVGLGMWQEQTLLWQWRKVFYIWSSSSRSNACRVPRPNSLLMFPKWICNSPHGKCVWRLAPDLGLSIVLLNSLARGKGVLPLLDHTKGLLPLALQLVLSLAEEDHHQDDHNGQHTEDSYDDGTIGGQGGC